MQNDLMSDQRELGQRLQDLGFAVGLAKSGRLLRIDNREATQAASDQMIQAIVACAGLKELYLRNLDDAGRWAADFVKLQKLQVLDLEGGQLSDDALQLFSDENVLPKLQVLNVRQTQVTSDCVARLRKVMIGTRIIHGD